MCPFHEFICTCAPPAGCPLCLSSSPSVLEQAKRKKRQREKRRGRRKVPRDLSNSANFIPPLFLPLPPPFCGCGCEEGGKKGGTECGSGLDREEEKREKRRTGIFTPQAPLSPLPSSPPPFVEERLHGAQRKTVASYRYLSCFIFYIYCRCQRPSVPCSLFGDLPKIRVMYGITVNVNIPGGQNTHCAPDQKTFS